MAGNYPDVVSWRMAYDRDGTQVFSTYHGGQLSAASVAAMNNETGAGAPGTPGNFSSGTFVVIFPEPRDLDGVFRCLPGGGGRGAIEVSTNTTNGVDGTWTTYGNPGEPEMSAVSMRVNVFASTALGIKALRWAWSKSSANSGGNQTLHLYGERSAGGPNTKRLELWHPTLDQRVGQAYFDWGDAARGSTAAKDFRVKNLHGSLTAHAVRVAMEALTDTNPTTVGQQQITKDGGASWGAQQTIGDLAPGAISSVLTVRRVTLTTAVLSLWWNRIFAETTTGWS